MAIHQAVKQSDLEKRLRLLRQQVYGKSPDRSSSTRTAMNQRIGGSDTLTYRQTDTIISSDTAKSDIAYLRYDLVKILALSSAAIGIQVVLFFLSRNHILNLKFF